MHARGDLAALPDEFAAFRDWRQIFLRGADRASMFRATS
jgi:hypothetical protein